MCGHPKYVKLMQKMFEQLVDSYIKTGYSNPKPHMPAMVSLYDSCRTFDIQLGLRKQYCKFNTEQEYLTSPQRTTSTNPIGCRRAVGLPSRKIVPGHQRGEAVDFIFIDIDAFNANGSVQLLRNNSIGESKEDWQKQIDHEVRAKIASMTKIVVDGEELTLVPIRDGSEGWHFSTNGG